MAKAREDCLLHPVAESDMRDVVHYEDNLAACYEAEYLLSLKMQEEMRSEELYRRFDYYDESELISGFLQPGVSQPETSTLHSNGVVTFTRASCSPSYSNGCLEVAEDCIMDCTNGLSLPVSSCTMNGTDYITGVCKTSLISVQTSDQVVGPLADKQSIFKSSNSLGSQSHLISTSGPTPSFCGGSDSTPDVVDGSHLDGPMRKKTRYSLAPEC